MSRLGGAKREESLRRRRAWRRKTSSSTLQKSWAQPGSPWRAARPKSWRSTRAGAVRLGGDHVQPAPLGDAGGKLDVRPAAGHVGGDGDLPALPGLGDDRRLLGGLRGVEHAVLLPAGGKAAAHLFRRQNAARANQHRHALFVQLAHAIDHRVPLLLGRLKQASGQVLADAGAVGRNADHRALVDLPQLAGRLPCRARHSAHDRILAEEALETDAARFSLSAVTVTPSFTSIA